MKSKKSKDKRQEMRGERRESAEWAKARLQAAQIGITLTRRKDSDGHYVCYLNKQARKSILFGL